MWRPWLDWSVHFGPPLVICWPSRNNWTHEPNSRVFVALVLPKPGCTVRPSKVDLVIQRLRQDIPCTSADALSTLVRLLPSWLSSEKSGNPGAGNGVAGSGTPSTLRPDAHDHHHRHESLGGAP